MEKKCSSAIMDASIRPYACSSNKGHIGIKREDDTDHLVAPKCNPAREDVETLYSALRTPLLNFFKRRLPQDEDPEDNLHALFKRAVEIRDKPHISMSRYLLFKIAGNMVTDRFRWRTRHHVQEMSDVSKVNVADTSPDQEQALAGKQRLQEFCARLKVLPDRCREVFLLHRVYGLSHKQVALKLGISVSTVEKHMIKATEKVNIIMKEML